MSLKKVLKKFSLTFGREDEDYGTIMFNEVELKQKELDDLSLFYEYLKFDKHFTIGGEFFMNIQPSSNIKKSQNGWYFITDSNGKTLNDDTNWDKNWIVFGDRNGDAIYFNKNDKGIYGSVNKKRTYKLSNSLEQFFFVLNECMKLEQNKYKFETVDEDDEVLDSFINDVNEILKKEIEKSNSVDFISFFFE
ncbi:hypothetical protein [uncultured Maribacter sp.]|uniref:hypothetical protein n=1 Tax=uncultured Maribacter sp. TaxID=431308 RepID=UPI00262EA3EE|nr:hypothetical protein [uncultured Maribacter sp.]